MQSSSCVITRVKSARNRQTSTQTTARSSPHHNNYQEFQNKLRKALLFITIEMNPPLHAILFNI